MSHMPQKMQRNIYTQHPAFTLGGRRVSGPILALLLLASPYIARLSICRRYIRAPSFAAYLENGLFLFHLSLHTYQICWVLIQNDAKPDTVIPLLQYLTLIIGGAALRGRDFWTYTPIAAGWILITHPSKTWLTLTLSIISALQIHSHSAAGLGVSATSLLMRSIIQAFNGQGRALDLLSTRLPTILLPYPCILWYARSPLAQRQRERYRRSFLELVDTALQHTTAGGLRRHQCARCSQAAIALVMLLGASWIESSFFWSCFRWRWLFLGQQSHAPSWTPFSFVGGMLIFSVVGVLKSLRRREATADLEVFVRNQLKDCWEGTWWTVCLYVVLWALCEALVMLESV